MEESGLRQLMEDDFDAPSREDRSRHEGAVEIRGGGAIAEAHAPQLQNRPLQLPSSLKNPARLALMRRGRRSEPLSLGASAEVPRLAAEGLQGSRLACFQDSGDFAQQLVPGVDQGGLF